ncbi:NAD-dependent epimerase/dehydratase family protein [Paucibacter sp. O1-1]|nr:NAD-dependent epimerase/dehydratase family protein [Paucibacter sp. O1-1]MDA3830931.1 NAD-dependent epimerase/dehydratase family protein [Paucibacter sp. O1-1]
MPRWGCWKTCARAAKAPRFVFASTIAAYGEHLPPVVDEATLPNPGLSYGAHKQAGEYLVADATRKGCARVARCACPAWWRARAMVRG